MPYEVGGYLLGGLIAEGLDVALVGKKEGAAVDAKAYAPPHAPDHPLAGLEIAIRAKVLEVKRPDLPDVDEAFAKSFDVASTEDLLAEVRRSVTRDKEHQRDRMIDDLALAQLIEKCDFELPEELIAAEAEDLARRAAYEMQQRSVPEEEIAKRVSELKSRRLEETAREMKAFFLLDKIVEMERILVTETEVREAVAQIAAYNGQTLDRMYTTLRESGRLGSLRNQLREKKARAKLRGKVKVTDAAPAAEDGADAPAKKTRSKKK
jgi:trigger factor